MESVAIGQLAVVFLAGMAGSFHCIGMCGGFACALGRSPGGGHMASVERHLIFNSGRMVSYTFVGAMAGMLGSVLLSPEEHSGSAVIAQRILATLAGALMIVMALQFLGYLRRLHARATGHVSQAVTVALQSVLRAPGRSAPLAFGVFNGFLPCPLVYAFAALAAATANPVHGALVMLVFGLGTFPAMLLTGGLGNWIRYGWRQRGVRIAGVFILVLGVITLARGVLPLDSHGIRHLHLPAATLEQEHHH